MQEIDTEILEAWTKLPESVKEHLTPFEYDVLKRVQSSFDASSGYVDEYLRGEDIEMNLYYIVHDWIGDRGKEYNRNDALISELQILADLLEKIKDAEKCLVS